MRAALEARNGDEFSGVSRTWEIGERDDPWPRGLMMPVSGARKPTCPPRGSSIMVFHGGNAVHAIVQSFWSAANKRGA
jgi:hypothetical protein